MSDGWIRACSVLEVPAGQALGVELKTEGGSVCPVAVVLADGAAYAIRDVCSHAEVALSEGDVEGLTVECWLHGSQFDLRTGQPTGLPATKPVPVYEAKIDGDDVLVRIEEK
jgi:3-phenylpropionate/trans-cinnamate dioxygenase ferredoxin subunit